MTSGRQQQFKLGDIDVEVLFNEAENRVANTPSIYDLEALLGKLRKRHPVEVWWLRHYLKWMMKKCSKELGIDMRNPYWQSRRSRLQ